MIKSSDYTIYSVSILQLFLGQTSVLWFNHLCPILSTSQDVVEVIWVKAWNNWDIQMFTNSYSFCISVQFSHSVVSHSLHPHGLQHTRPPCSSPSAGACSNSCPSSQWCHPTISSSVIPFSSCLQSFPASESFPRSQFFASGGQSIRISALIITPSNE